jgi:Protein of unknown function (DUF2844)
MPHGYALLIIFLLLPPVSCAQLGHSEESTDRQLRSLKLPKSESHIAKRYRYKQFSSEKVIVKQYVNPATKTVFAMTWKGSRAPSLVDFLGFDPLKINGPGVARSLHTTLIRTENLSIDILFVGGLYTVSAVRTDLLPNGVTADVVGP